MSRSSNSDPSIEPKGARPGNPSGAVHPTVFMFLWAALGFGLTRLHPLPLPAWSATDPLGKALALGGVVLVVWSFLEFRKHRTTLEHNSDTIALVTSGPFRISRNPVYLGLVAIFLGIAVRYDNAWFAVLIPGFAVAVHFFTIRREEAYLERRFGEAFTEYRASVRRWL